MISPSFSVFERVHESGAAQVVWTTLTADLETPVAAMLKLGVHRANSFLLESVEDGERRGRYSVIGLDPDVIWRVQGERASIFRDGSPLPCPPDNATDDALESLRGFLAESRIDLPDELPSMAAGVFGYMGYDTAGLMESLPAPGPDFLKIPDGIFLRPTLVAVFDSVRDVVTLVTPVRPSESDAPAQDAYDAAVRRLTDARDTLTGAMPESPARSGHDSPGKEDEEIISNTPPDDYKAMVLRAKEYIAAGDVFQVVLSQRFDRVFSLPPFALYRALRRINPSPFLYYLNFGDFSVVGSSPEILVRVESGTITIRPVAGTRPRGTVAEDAKIGEDLLSDPKERAEHLMLLDLGRNDAGRVSRIGSVEVTEQFALQLTSHLIHIVSNVQGTLNPGEDALSALTAGFPAGTVSGAPKIRAMEIISELEKDKRGLYAGCIGYFSAGGDMDSCIALRTAVIKDGMMHVQAGSGVVADSDPDYEFNESVNKAAALFRAASEAVRYAAAD